MYCKECNTLVEKLHSKVCKQILNVHKTTSNYGVRLELGRMPLYVNIISKTLKYYIQITRRTCVNSLLKSAFKLHEANTSNWYMAIKNVLEFTGYSLDNFNISNIKSSSFSVVNQLKSFIEKQYLARVRENVKLTLYSQLKKILIREKYLEINDPTVRKSVTQLRLSNHKLPIETGRYTGIDRNNRLCTLCKCSTGDEYHCLMQCYHPKLTDLRNKFLSKIFQIEPALQHLSRKCLFIYILLLHDESILAPCMQYIHKLIQLYAM